jgi:predicted phage tail protein
MPLNEREKRILEEIERQFYQEDPKLAQTVAKTTLESVTKRWNRYAAVGFVVGLVVMLTFFTSENLAGTLIAGGGFVIMLASAGWIAMNLRRGRSDSDSSFSLEGWMERTRRRWRRDR